MELLQEISKTLKEADISVKDEDIKKRIDTLTSFKVPEKEIRRSILSYFGLSAKSVSQGGDNPIGPVSDIISDGMWTSLKVKVVQLWDNTHESIDQVGIVGDESGTVKFTKWASAKLPKLEEGKSYLLVNVVSSIFNEKMQVSLNKKSKMESIDDIEVKDNTMTFIGAFVAMQDNSGLITRCNTCNRAIRGKCSEHPEAEGHHDLRIIGTVDNGMACIKVIMDASVIESLTGFTVESAREVATVALDKEVVGDQLGKLLLGKFVFMSGPDMGDAVLAKAMMPYVKSIPDKELEALIAYIGSD